MSAGDRERAWLSGALALRAARSRPDWPLRVRAELSGRWFAIEVADAEAHLGTLGVLTIIEEALDLIRDWYERLAGAGDSSIVSALNEEAGDRAIGVDEDVFDLLAACERVHRASGGAFDPVVHGLGASSEGVGAVGLAGGLAELKNELMGDRGSSVCFGDVVLDRSAGTVRYGRRAMRVDLGGVANGLALDEAAVVLRGAGIRSALLSSGTTSVEGNGGSEWVAVGSSAWTVRVPGGVDGPVIELRDSAMAVSSSCRVHGLVGGGCGGSAVVVCESARDADAWATAIAAAGRVDEAMAAGLPDGARTFVRFDDRWERIERVG